MAIYYLCSDGERVTQTTINSRRAASYRRHDDSTVYCRGCGGRAEGHAHIIPQARCKTLHKTELIWDPINYVKACNSCNQKIENVSAPAFTKLLCVKMCLEVFEKHDPARFSRACSNMNNPATENEQISANNLF